MTRGSLLAAMACLSLAACSAQTKGAAAGEEGAVKAADAALGQAVAAKDLNKIMVHYADDAVLMPAAEPLISGKPAIAAEWKHILSIPQLENLSKLGRAEVSSAGDLAYTMGSYRSRMMGESGVLVDEPGKWLSIWKKQPDGKWRIIVETYNTDIPPPDHK